ncbi:MAG: hypothetical protein RLZ12_277 [Bacillota bacterium]|jgi:large subunit ribosomal protein L32
MAVPFRRTSKTRKRLRRTHYKLKAPTIVRCSQCTEFIEPHHVCSHCGYYNGTKVM